MTTPVIYPTTLWHPVSEMEALKRHGIGPSGQDIYIWYPKDKRIGTWSNWDGSGYNILRLKKSGVTHWADVVTPLPPDLP